MLSFIMSDLFRPLKMKIHNFYVLHNLYKTICDILSYVHTIELYRLQEPRIYKYKFVYVYIFFKESTSIHR